RSSSLRTTWNPSHGSRRAGNRSDVLSDPLAHLPKLDHDVAGSLVDPSRPALGARPEPLQGGPLVDADRLHEETIDVDVFLLLLRVGDGGANHLRDGERSRLRREAQGRQSLFHLLAPD